MPDHPARPRHRHHQHRTTLLSGRDASPRDEWPRPGHGTRSRSAKAMGGSRSETRSCDRPEPTCIANAARSFTEETAHAQGRNVGEPRRQRREHREGIAFHEAQSIPAHARSKFHRSETYRNATPDSRMVFKWKNTTLAVTTHQTDAPAHRSRMKRLSGSMTNRTNANSALSRSLTGFHPSTENARSATGRTPACGHWIASIGGTRYPVPRL